MLASLTSFVEELRRAGLPISLTESLDAASALTAISLESRDQLRSALCATLVKSVSHEAVFSSLFDVFFSAPGAPEVGFETGSGSEPPDQGAAQAQVDTSPGDASRLADPDAVRLLAQAALAANDEGQMTQVAGLAVALFAGIEPGRPVGASYYLTRTLVGLDLEQRCAALLEAVRKGSVHGTGDLATLAGALSLSGALGERLVQEELERRAQRLQHLIEAEVLRQLVAERGATSVGRSLKRTLVEDVDFMHATREELAALRRAVYPLTRVLAARLSRRRKHRRRGHLDFRSTIRRSMSTGGVPLEPRFRSPHPAKPEIVLLADVSGSVAAFARFTMHLVYALDAQFSKVRSFVFIDGVDEVSALLSSSSSLGEAIEKVATEAAVTHRDGHSDYGSALVLFHERYAKAVGPRTNVIVLGDARSNYHPPETWVLEDLRARARRLYWLNPEPRSYWGSGDSIAAQYARHCDAMYECRNLRQLEAFVDQLT